MSWLTYILPVLAAAFCIFTARGWMPVFAQGRLPESPEGAAARPRFGFAAENGRLTRLDAVLCLVITACYAVTAFTGLGDTTAPLSWCLFAERGQYALVDLGEQREIGMIRYYNGIRTGEYRLQFSDDGETWREAGTIEQRYNDLLKWQDYFPEAEGVDGSARYIRIVASAELDLGEIALYDAEGRLLDAAGFDYDAGCAPLFDEQETVPVRPGYMNSSYFDEIYHARTALEHIENMKPYEITHPPLGKEIIGLGIRLFGMTPFGWRFSGTLFGVLMLPILYVFLKRMFASSGIAACATVIFAFDFMHFVQTRIATIDTYSVFFILLMYLFMWRFVSGGRRRYLALSGLFFGLGAASKWTCIYAGAGLAVIWLAYWITQARRPRFAARFLGNCAFCLVFFVAVPLAVYYASYYHYGTANGLEGGVGMYFTRDYFDIVVDNQVYMWEYHSDLVSEHPYASRWYQWIIDARPILYYLEYFEDGSTKSAFGAFMNPVFCWTGLLAMAANVLLMIKDRDGRAAFTVIGYLAQLLPWVLVTRLTFAYHYFPSELFLLLALANVWRKLGELAAPNLRRNMYAVTGACTGLFVAFYPVLTGLRCALWYTRGLLKWFPSWPF